MRVLTDFSKPGLIPEVKVCDAYRGKSRVSQTLQSEGYPFFRNLYPGKRIYSKSLEKTYLMFCILLDTKSISSSDSPFAERINPSYAVFASWKRESFSYARALFKYALE